MSTTSTLNKTSLLDDARWDSNIFTGQWQAGGGEPIAITEPATGDSLGTAGGASVEDVHRSATAAAAAQKQWAAMKPSERAAVLRRAGTLFEEHAKEIETWIVCETGGVPTKAALETHVAAAECFEAARHLP